MIDEPLTVVVGVGVIVLFVAMAFWIVARGKPKNPPRPDPD